MSAEALPIAKFRVGRILAAPLAVETITREDILSGLTRHMAGDWGDIPEDDKQANDRALIEGGGLLSKYRTSKGQQFLISTAADRRVTTIMLPSEC